MFYGYTTTKRYITASLHVEYGGYAQITPEIGMPYVSSMFRKYPSYMPICSCGTCVKEELYDCIDPILLLC